MQSSRKERRDYIKQLKKKNPNMTKAELETAKAAMAQLGKQQNEELQKRLMEEGGGKIISADTILEDELEVQEEDFAPLDLED
jgi:hypothetical protein